ncbi:MAG: isochorismatase family protein [Burkholderiales bacterium]
MLLDVNDSHLLLVDYQIRLMPALFDGAGALANGVRLGQMAKLLQVPITGTEQNPAGLGESAPEIRALCDTTLAKMHFSACADGLVQLLRPPVSQTARPQSGNVRSLPKHLQKPPVAAPGSGRNTIVMGGCETHVCFMQTALDLLDEEFEVWVVTDACASRTERNRDAAFDRLASAGAELLTTEMVAFEWLRTAQHPQFKAVLGLVK